MSKATDLDHATTMIEKAWAHSIDVLEALALQQPARDPLLRSVMHIRSSLVISSDILATHQERLHAMTRPGHVPAFYDQERITRFAAELRVVQAESRTALQAISYVIEAREAAIPTEGSPAIRLAPSAVARSAQLPPAPGQPDQRAVSAVASPGTPTGGPRR